ncbi:PleD family two-component system response regulator [Novosphingobium sp. FSW06-99]|uniref:response regulator n=1 Tax=Novosphingobium sp. FSW06-99 TaxID=1739113 RepID=UPI00076CDFCA|nr:response regulator [Novosphingobium sp. FSW06-99]KUR74834.1 hypothetical protein AQZ49_16305 [Novosphingobium sp. FSW06-99]
MAHILVADDDDIVADILLRALESAGHLAARVDNGPDAVRVVQSRCPDLMILDYDLPLLHGLGVLRAIRNRHDTRALPVVMLTASRSREDENIATYVGANAYLRKPCDPDYLIYRVEDLLDTIHARNAMKDKKSI